MILGDVAESEFRKGIIMFNGDWTVFFTRPISLASLSCAVIFTILPLYQNWRENQKKEST